MVLLLCLCLQHVKLSDVSLELHLQDGLVADEDVEKVNKKTYNMYRSNITSVLSSSSITVNSPGETSLYTPLR